MLKSHFTSVIAFACLLPQFSYAEQRIDEKDIRPTIDLRGKIDYPLAEALSVKSASLVTIDSGGGKGGAFILLAEKLLASHSTLSLPRRCFSGCAEVLLPSPIPKLVSEDTLFALHFNAQIMDHLEAVHFPGQFKGCNAHEAEMLEDYRRGLGLDTEFWRLQLAHLNFQSVARVSDEDCAFALNIANAWWVPNAEQIRDGFGVEFNRSICNDSFECLERSAGLLLKPGQRLIWGSSLYQFTQSGTLQQLR